MNDPLLFKMKGGGLRRKKFRKKKKFESIGFVKSK
jgi:hypothetical protein